MKNFYQKILIHNTAIIPSSIEKRFRDFFRHPKCVEWSKTGDHFEALFFENSHEKIARFDQSGKLLEIRTNQPPLEFAAPENHPVRAKGDLMNYIQIQSGKSSFHELIIRKPDLKRILVFLDDRYEIIREELL